MRVVVRIEESRCVELGMRGRMHLPEPKGSALVAHGEGVPPRLGHGDRRRYVHVREADAGGQRSKFVERVVDMALGRGGHGGNLSTPFAAAKREERE